MTVYSNSFLGSDLAFLLTITVCFSLRRTSRREQSPVPGASVQELRVLWHYISPPSCAVSWCTTSRLDSTATKGRCSACHTSQGAPKAQRREQSRAYCMAGILGCLSSNSLCILHGRHSGVPIFKLPLAWKEFNPEQLIPFQKQD